MFEVKPVWFNKDTLPFLIVMAPDLGLADWFSAESKLTRKENGRIYSTKAKLISDQIIWLNHSEKLSARPESGPMTIKDGICIFSNADPPEKSEQSVDDRGK